MKKVINKIMYVLDIILKDLSSLGSLVGYMFVTCLFFALDYVMLSVKLFIGLFLSYLAVFFIRIFYFKDRPQKQKHNDLITKLDSSSFPSAHSMRVLILLVLVYVYTNNILLHLIFLGVFLGVCYSRIYLKKHYLIDVVGGIIIGSFISCGLVYMI